MKPCGEIRGMLGKHGDSKTWLDAMEGFPNGVPRFGSRDDCFEFMQTYNATNNSFGSNPELSHLRHIFTMLVNWEQIERYLLPEIVRARKEPSSSSSESQEQDTDRPNVYESEECLQVLKEIDVRLNYPFHKCTNLVSTWNTLQYLFYHMKCGIFVMIRGGSLRIFAPFVNSEYRNTWGDVIRLEGDNSLDSYYSKKSGLYREEIVEPDRYFILLHELMCNLIVSHAVSHFYIVLDSSGGQTEISFATKYQNQTTLKLSFGVITSSHLSGTCLAKHVDCERCQTVSSS